MDALGTAYVIQTGVIIAIGVFGYLMTRSINNIDKKISDNDTAIKCTDEKIKNVEQQMNDFKIDVAKEYVTKTDFNETTGKIMSKLDKIMDLIMEINKR